MSEIILIAGLYIVLGFFEMQYPAQSGQQFKSRFRNIIFAIFLYIGGLLSTVVIFILLPIYFKFLHFRYLPDQGIIFSLFVLLLYLFLTDFIFYWYHRAEHRFGTLWAIHELHHSDTELNATTSMRSYWLERPLQSLLIALPLSFLIGVDTLAAALLPFALIIWLFFTHTNVKLSLGHLTGVFTGPQMHRIHHSNLPEHRDKNFAQYFPVIDMMFGTYYKPRPGEFPTTGTSGLPSNVPIEKALIRPFQVWFNFLIPK